MSDKKENKHGFLKGCGCGCLSVIILSILIVVFAYGCSGGNSNSDTNDQATAENAEVEEYIRKANTYYAETGAYVQGIADLTTAENYEETRENVMHQTSDLQQRIQADLNQIPEDTTDSGLKLARQALDIDNNICLALYATLSTNDPSGADLISQYVEQYNNLKPELDKYIN